MAKKRFLILAISLLIGIWVVRLLPTAPGFRERDTKWHLERARAEMPRARQLWESQAITNYNIDYYWLYHRGLNEGTLHVRNGVAEEDLRSHLDVPSMFDVLEESLEEFDPDEVMFSVQFDPTYGFITEYFAAPSINSDSNWISVYRFSNFRPVENEQE